MYRWGTYLKNNKVVLNALQLRVIDFIVSLKIQIPFHFPFFHYKPRMKMSSVCSCSTYMLGKFYAAQYRVCFLSFPCGKLLPRGRRCLIVMVMSSKAVIFSRPAQDEAEAVTQAEAKINNTEINQKQITTPQIIVFSLNHLLLRLISTLLKLEIFNPSKA